LVIFFFQYFYLNYGDVSQINFTIFLWGFWSSYCALHPVSTHHAASLIQSNNSPEVLLVPEPILRAVEVIECTNYNALVIHAECPVVRDNWLEILFGGCGHMIQAGGKTTTKTTLAKKFVLVLFWHSCVCRLRGVVLKTILRNWWWHCSVAAPYMISI